MFDVGTSRGQRERSNDKLNSAKRKNFLAKSTLRLEKTLGRVKVVESTVEIYPDNMDGKDASHTKKFEHQSTFVTYTHFTKSMFAPSVMVIPYGFMHGGLTFTIFGFLAVVTVSAYNMKRLCVSAEYLSARAEKVVRTYDEVAYMSFYTCTDRTRNFAATSKFIVNCLVFITNLDACTILMIFVAQNFQHVISYHFPDLFLTIHHYLFLQVIFLMAMGSIRDLKYITPFSFVSAFLLVIVVVATTAFYLADHIPDSSKRVQVASVGDMFRSLCICVFCVSGITISLTLKSSMSNPKYFFAFPGVYISSLVIHCFTYIPFGFLGYLKYGSETLPCIMLNILPENILAICIKMCALFAVFLTSPIVFYVAFNVLWSNYIKDLVNVENILLLEFLLRYLLIIVSSILAHLFPYMDTKIILRGALFNVHLEVTIPAILDYVTFYPEKGTGRCYCRLVRVMFFIIFGIIICLVGLVLELS